MKRRLFLLLGVLGLCVAIVAVMAIPAMAQGLGPGGNFCAPWTWAWFRTGNGWWYWQWFHDCWSPQGGWFRIWGGWGWA